MAGAVEAAAALDEEDISQEPVKNRIGLGRPAQGKKFVELETDLRRYVCVVGQK